MSDMTETVEYFFKEYHNFREILCSIKYSIEQKLDAFRGLFTVYVNVKTENKEEEKKIQIAMMDLKTETDMRLGYQAMADIEAIFEAIL